MKKYCRGIFALLFAIVPFFSFAQNAEIEITDLAIENNQMVIYYDIIKAKKKQTFEIWPEITTSNGQKINASSFSGDYGEGVPAGLGKKIIWDYNADGVVLNDKVYVEVKAKIALTNSNVSVGKALLLSAIVPGLGLNKVKGGGIYWLMSVPVYGLAAGAIANYNSANDYYDDYLNTPYENPDEANQKFEDAEDAQQNQQIFTYSAIGVWAINMIWTGISAKKNKRTTAFNYRKRTLFFTRINPATKTVGFTFKYRF